MVDLMCFHCFNIIAIELAEGTSLYDLLHKKHHQPSPEQTQQWATEIAEGRSNVIMQVTSL